MIIHYDKPHMVLLEWDPLRRTDPHLPLFKVPADDNRIRQT